MTLYSDFGGETGRLARAGLSSRQQFAFTGVKPGIVHLVATACDSLFTRTLAIDGSGLLGPVVLAPSKTPPLGLSVVGTDGAPRQAVVTLAPETSPGDPTDPVAWFPTLQFVTDAEGILLIEGLPRGPFRLVVSAMGHLPVTSARVVPSGGPLRITLVQESTLTLKVVKPSGPDGESCSAGAMVRLHFPAAGTWMEGVTGSDGTATFGGLGPGRYLADATSGDLLTYAPAVAELSEGTRVGIELHLKPGLWLGGTVVDAATSLPLEGACVVVSSRTETGRLACGSTDVKGRFRILGLTPGRYTIVIQAPGYHRVRISSQRMLEQGEPPLLDVVMQRAFVLEGEVTDEAGVGVSGARVLVDEEEKLSAGLIEGLMQVHLPNLLTPDPGLLPVGDLGVTMGPVPPIPLTTGPVQVPPAGVGAGVATIPPGCECLTSAAIVQQTRVVTDEAGRFRLGALSAGEMRLVVIHPSYATLRSGPITVPPEGSISPVVLVLSEGGSVGGRVVDTSGDPLAGATVWIESDSVALLDPIDVEMDGTYRADHVAGELVISASMSGYFSVTRSVTLAPGTSSMSVDLVLEPEGELVQARVLNPWEYPVTNAVVTVSTASSEEEVTRTLFTDSDGMLEFPALPGDLWRIVVKHPEYRTLHAALQAWNASEEPSLIMGFAAGVSGTVRDTWSYLPVESFTITVQYEQQSTSTHAGTGGQFEITDLPAGLCTLVVKAEGYETLTKELSLPQGQGPTQVTLPDQDLWLDPSEPRGQ